MNSDTFREKNSLVIKPQPELLLPDNTFINSIFSNNDVSNDFMDKLSLAKGRIAAHTSSKVHLHPIVTQVTYVLSGKLEVVMKGQQDAEPYKAHLNPGESIVTEPQTFFQLVNNTETDCEVLYIVNPAFLFELSETGDEVIYNDAFVFDETWQQLESNQWMHDVITNANGKFTVLREAAKQRMKQSTTD